MILERGKFAPFEDVPTDILKLPQGHPLSRAVGRVVKWKMRDRFLDPQYFQELITLRKTTET